MLGCVVSLTSSHLSGSTIRDVNTGGSVLCSNSSFSSLLPSPNAASTPGTVKLPSGATETFVDGSEYLFTEESGHTTSTTRFSNCHFTSTGYQINDRPITLSMFRGTVSILSCSFTNILSDSGSGGAIYLYNEDYFNRTSFTVDSSNFTNCSTTKFGGAMSVHCRDDILITSCRFEACSAKSGGGLSLFGFGFAGRPPLMPIVDCVIADCTATQYGGGVHAQGETELSVVDSKFERCELIGAPDSALGGGISVYGYIPLTVEGSHFIKCRSEDLGGAIGTEGTETLRISDTLVKECSSGTTGAIYIRCYGTSGPVSFSQVFFDGNWVGDDTTSFTNINGFHPGIPWFTDLAFRCTESTSIPPTLTIVDFFTATILQSIGMVVDVYDPMIGDYNYERKMLDEFDNIGPLLTAAPIARVNEETGKIELEMEGETPLTSQEYEVTVKEDKIGTETRLRMLFSDGIGTLVSGSEVNLKYSTGYTIISIVGVVPEPSSSRMTNAIEVPVAAWAFNLAVTPDILTFTTPTEPPPSHPSLTIATAYLLSKEPECAYIVLVFDKDVFGSFDIVVEEEGTDVTITVPIIGTTLTGESDKMVVVGDDRLLTHDTTYTIKSITPTPNITTTTVWMSNPVSFHIPKSSYVPPEEPEDPEDPSEPLPEDPEEPEDPTEPEPEDPTNKKALSAETKKLLSWLIPLVACLLVALVLAIIIIVLLRRQQKKNAEPAQKEMEAQEPIDVEKVEEFGVDCSDGMIRTDGHDHSAFVTSDDHQTKINPSEAAKSSLSRKKGELVEVMACSGDFGISTVPMTNTLYSVLHKEHREIGKRGVGIQIVNGLKQVVAHRPASDVLTRLSSHWILIDGSGNVQLKLEMNASEAEQEAARALSHSQPLPNLEGNSNQPSEHTQTTNINKSGMDGLRWRAPEVVAADGKSGVESVDGHKASVFSLGLVLWEIETGQVPFGELDAVNAQRQSGTGIGPNIESLKNEEIIALIHRCLSVDPKQRPTLSEIGEFLSSHPDDSQIAFGKELKEP
ncbi:hypothetical protein BLNAU_16285 [Blattamonas nauphoetae]|uniref:Protein kinase domain-containing protein n=1 Tax=Blattamonas nauphoetae TaxID=2049346 RepID=A0ABQ9XBY2_9EUKA|nr:hypothetical protein BLNAU_16285 [Blattamonas nauphoetae]